MKTTHALMIRSRDIIHGGRIVVVDGLPMVLPFRQESAGCGRRSSGGLDNKSPVPSVGRDSVDGTMLPAMTGARSSACGH